MSKVRVKSSYKVSWTRYSIQARVFYFFWTEVDWCYNREEAMRKAQQYSAILEEKKNFKSEVIKY